MKHVISYLDVYKRQILNYVLIYGNFGFPKLGVAGASLATIIGQFVAFVIALVYVMSGKRYLHLRIREGFKPDFEELAHIFRIGFPAMIEQFVMRAGMITYSKTVASLGTVPVSYTHLAVWIMVAVPISHTIETVILSYPITWGTTSIMFILYYLQGGWLKRRIQKAGFAPEIRHKKVKQTQI